MKLTLLVAKEVAFDAVRLRAELRYPEEDCPDGMFGLTGDVLDVVIDLEPVAKIRGWKGPSIDLHTKVCDCCSVWLLDGDTVVATRENDYVPGFMPGEHYGDYVILDIDSNGVIANWEKHPDYRGSFEKQREES